MCLFLFVDSKVAHCICKLCSRAFVAFEGILEAYQDSSLMMAHDRAGSSDDFQDVFVMVLLEMVLCGATGDFDIQYLGCRCDDASSTVNMVHGMNGNSLMVVVDGCLHDLQSKTLLTILVMFFANLKYNKTTI